MGGSDRELRDRLVVVRYPLTRCCALTPADVLPHIINAVILSSAWSCGNSFMYSASRNLYGLAITGNAPKIFARCTKRGIPIYAVIAVACGTLVSFMVVSDNSAKVFDWFLTVTTLSSLFNWLTLFLSTIRFRQAFLAQGLVPADMPFTSPFMPYAAYYGCGMVIFFILICGFDVFFPENWSGKNFMSAYCGVLLFVVPFIGHKVYSLFVKGERMRPPHEIDIYTGKAEVDEYERMNPDPVARNVWEKIWFAVA